MLLRSLLATALCLSSLDSLAAQPAYTLTPLGPGCGATLTATFTPIGNGSEQLTLSLTSGFPQAHAFVYFGVDPLNFTFPGTQCHLYTLPIWIKPDRTDANGAATWQRAWPRSVIGYYRIQCAVARIAANGALEFQLTDGVLAQHQ